MSQSKSKIGPAKGRLGILTPGMGAVATTFFAGVEAVRQGLGKPIGSLTQMGTIRLGKRTDNRIPKIKDFLPLAKLEDIVFGGWDIYEDNAFQAASKAGVLDKDLLAKIRPQLEAITPMAAVFDHAWVKNISGPNVKKGPTKMDLAEQLRADIRGFIKRHELDRVVIVWCASTESYVAAGPAHQNLKVFEQAMRDNDPTIAPSMIYAYAALMEGVPFANGAPTSAASSSATSWTGW